MTAHRGPAAHWTPLEELAWDWGGAYEIQTRRGRGGKPGKVRARRRDRSGKWMTEDATDAGFYALRGRITADYGCKPVSRAAAR